MVVNISIEYRLLITFFFKLFKHNLVTELSIYY